MVVILVFHMDEHRLTTSALKVVASNYSATCCRNIDIIVTNEYVKIQRECLTNYSNSIFDKCISMN